MSDQATTGADLQRQLLEFVERAQEAIVDAVEQWRDAGEQWRQAGSQLIPDLPTLPLNDLLPKPEDVIAGQFELAQELLAAQRRFAEELLEAFRPAAKEG